MQAEASWGQISHPGRQCPRLVRLTPLAPSAVQLDLMGNFNRPRAATEADILDIVARFARSARLLKQAGFDGVQIHGAHGYLLSQFLSPRTNLRNDAWGGRFPTARDCFSRSSRRSASPSGRHTRSR